jgi:hypothetical protein
MAENTLLLRAPASIPTATNRHKGSCQPGRGWTSMAPAATVASTASASMPAKSGGVCVAVATAATYSPSQPGRTSTGKVGSGPTAPKRTGGVQPRSPTPAAAVVVSASSPARWASTAGSASQWASRTPRSITRRRRAASATRRA